MSRPSHPTIIPWCRAHSVRATLTAEGDTAEGDTAEGDTAEGDNKNVGCNVFTW